jgi:hypothetical protein
MGRCVRPCRIACPPPAIVIVARSHAKADGGRISESSAAASPHCRDWAGCANREHNTSRLYRRHHGSLRGREDPRRRAVPYAPSNQRIKIAFGQPVHPSLRHEQVGLGPGSAPRRPFAGFLKHIVDTPVVGDNCVFGHKKESQSHAAYIPQDNVLGFLD